MTIITDGDEQIVEQIIKQLRKVITTIKVVDMNYVQCVEREMVLIKVNALESSRAEILRIVDIFRCKVVDVSTIEMTIEATGDKGKIDALINLLQRFGIKELARTGSVAMRRSMQQGK
jgi:acetolactate synthase-1/3 small subunit